MIFWGVGMLEVIESDFLRLKAETGADEAQAAKEYDAFMKEATTNKGEKKLLYLTNPQANALAEDMETRGLDRFLHAFVSPTPPTRPNTHLHHPRLRRRNDDDPAALPPSPSCIAPYCVPPWDSAFCVCSQPSP